MASPLVICRPTDDSALSNTERTFSRPPFWPIPPTEYWPYSSQMLGPEPRQRGCISQETGKPAPFEMQSQTREMCQLRKSKESKAGKVIASSMTPQFTSTSIAVQVERERVFPRPALSQANQIQRKPVQFFLGFVVGGEAASHTQ